MKRIKRKTNHTKIEPFFVIILIVLIAYVISLLVPLIWTFLTSFKGRGDYVLNKMGFPKTFQFKNYVVAIENFYIDYDNGPVAIDGMLANSLIYALGCSFALTAGNCLVAYCCAMFSRFKISSVYTTIVIVAMALPIIGSEPSSLQMLMALGFYDNLFCIILCQIRFLGLYYLVFLSAFKGIPKDYAEAAYIDGAGNFTVFFKLMLPFVSKTFLTVMLIHFIVYWNDYQTPLLYMPTHPTLAYGLYRYSHSYKAAISSTPMKMAGCMILFLPILVIFCIFQRQLIGNVMMGGVKE